MTNLSRRSVFGTGAGIVAVSALAGCSNDKNNGGEDGGGASGDQVEAPQFQAPEGPKPDIEGDHEIPDTFFNYPSEPYESVKEKPGDGKPIRILTQNFAPVTAKPPQNNVWANLNEVLGSELDIQQIPAGDYKEKFQTTIAGSQLPDMFFVAEIPDMDNTIQATCLDLSEYLAGDKILQYPNLAAIPSDCWDAGRYGGRLYGLPSPRGAMSSGVLYRRDDLLKEKGGIPEWKSFDEFFKVCQDLNDPRGSRWATTMVPMQYIKNMLGIPNFWRWEDGEMKSWWMAEEFEQALEAGRKWAEAGLMHPDAFSQPNTKTWFSAGNAYFNPDAFSAWSQYFGGEVPEGFDIDVNRIPAFDGDGTGHLWLSFPSYGRSAINKNAADRVETLLKVANYLAAPFGTKEYLNTHFGQEGKDYELDGTDPIPTESGSQNREMGLKFIVDGRLPNYLPGHQESAKKLDAAIREMLPEAFHNDAVYLPSEEFSANFQVANGDFQGLESDIIQGRKQVSDWRPAAEQWWKESGQKMAEELGRAYEESGRGE